MTSAASKIPKASPVPDALTHLEATGDSRDVLEALCLMIERAGLGVGDRLPPEIEIAKKLDVGRSKVREALIAWQNMGIVTRNKKAGTRLAAEVSSNAIHLPVMLKLEAESLLRTHAVRRPLEIESVKIAAKHVSKQQGLVIIAKAADLMAVYEAGEDWRTADRRFHGAIHQASGNPLFEQFILQIQEGFNAIYEAPFGQPHLGQATIPLHPELAQAVADRDGVAAAAVMEKIMDMVETEVIAIRVGLFVSKPKPCHAHGCGS